MNKPKLSAAFWAFFRQEMGAQAFCEKLVEMGYSGAEMVDEANYKFAKAAGLELVNICAPGMSDGLNRVENHDALIPEIRQTIAHAAENDIKQIIIFSGNSNGQSAKEGLANCIRGVEKLAGDAESAGVILAFEPLNDANHHDYQATSSSYGYELVRAVSSPAVRVLYDIYHQARTGEDLNATLVKNIDLVCHLHVAGSPKRDFPGDDQEIDYASLMKAVQVSGYDGYWGMEFMPASDDPLTELAAAAKRFRAFAQA